MSHLFHAEFEFLLLCESKDKIHRTGESPKTHIVNQVDHKVSVNFEFYCTLRWVGCQMPPRFWL